MYPVFVYSEMRLRHKLDAMRQGRLDIQLQGDYYNRKLSGWEPLLESWRATVNWKLTDPIETNKSAFSVSSRF